MKEVIKLRSKIISKSVFTLIVIAFGLTFLIQNSNHHAVSAKSGGADIYRQNCITCHGADGKANTPKGKRKGATDLTKSTIGTAQGIKVITNGRELMPSFSDTLSDAEIREVMAFIRGFRK
jgi:mono/diheme cytochrome c family protein